MMAIDALELSGGDTVLIVGATGGVGSFAVQLAARAGATIVAPALAEDETYLRELGVSELLPATATSPPPPASAMPPASTRSSTW
jgi:NADPH2:quinone reductase